MGIAESVHQEAKSPHKCNAFRIKWLIVILWALHTIELGLSFKFKDSAIPSMVTRFESFLALILYLKAGDM